MSEHYATIYRITNKKNGYVYIGSTKNTIKRRFAVHWCHRNIYNTPLHQAMSQTNRDDWKVEAIAIVTKEHRWDVEAQITKQYRRIAAGCYNVIDGALTKGAEHPRATTVLDAQTGITYSTCKECAAAIGKSEVYISNNHKRFIYKRNKRRKKLIKKQK